MSTTESEFPTGEGEGLAVRDGLLVREVAFLSGEEELENGEEIIIVWDRDARLLGARGPPGTVGLARGMIDGGLLTSLVGGDVGIAPGCL